MINIQELRVNNWVSKIENTDINSCIQLGYTQIGYLFTYTAISGISYKFHPIPLTSEWLESAGFKETVQGVYVNGKYDIERLTADSEEWEFCIYENQTGTTIKYVHQLQNLFFCLSGKELEFPQP